MNKVRSKHGFTLPELVLVLVYLFAVGGYIANIAKLVKCDFKAPYKAEIIRGVGVLVPPVGAITGYLQIKD